MQLKFKRLDDKAILPIRAHKSDAGLDLTCTHIDTTLNEANQLMIRYHTDLAVEIPEGYVGLLMARSSIWKKSITPTNCVGVIDSGYRGEWFIPITNCNNVDLIIAKKDSFTDNIIHSYFGSKYKYILYPYEKAIAQFVMHLVPEFKEKEVSYEELQNIKSERGAGAFGSSGK